MNSSAHSFFLLAARCVLGAVFIVASVEKIAAPEGFAIAVEAYRLVPFSLINIFVLLVPWLELVCGIFLVAGIYVRASATMLSVLLAAFTLAIVAAIARGLDIDCGCFGPAQKSPVGWGKVLEDVGLLVLGGYIFLFSEPQPVPRPVPVSDESLAVKE